MFRTRNLILAAAAMLAVVLGGTSGASAAPASAAPPGCTAGYLCLWPSGTSSGPVRISGSLPDWSVIIVSSCPGGMLAGCPLSAAFNNGINCTAHLYTLANYVGARLDIPRATLVNLSGGSGNRFASNNWC
ncbi:hypothetical protein ACIA8K_17770 [Catenuloplanes sp. NPDC051500]|uniref:hypothetical protein n=1 Tax=Catenuloplanes sp. NPDC051500 TaxID=3363959 RepID=UPI0037B32117